MKKIYLIILSMILISFVTAGNSEIDYFYISEDESSLTNVQMLMYKCTDDSCTQVGEQLENLNSGDNNFISFTYPTFPETTYYLKWYLAENYIPKVYRTWQTGTGETWTRTYYFNKVPSCHSPIDSFSVTNSNYANEPVVVDVEANLEADASSAFNYNYDYFVPQGYDDYFSAETTVTLTIIDSSSNVVYTDSENLNLYMDTSENVQFEWTPTYNDTYTATIETEVIDSQCQSDFKETTSRIFEVWEERPLNQCYTIINDLEANPETAEQGENVEFLFDKISNYVDASGIKTPIPTQINYEIRDDSSNLIYSNNFLVEVNENDFDVKSASFNWLASIAGYLNVKVTGVAQSSLCDGKTNPEDIATLGLQVDAIEMYNVLFVVTDSATEELLQGANVELGIQTGETSSQGRVSFSVNPGDYSYEVSQTGYAAETGNLTISENRTITVELNSIQSDDTDEKNDSEENNESSDESDEDSDDDSDYHSSSRKKIILCTSLWECSEWGPCVDGIKLRTCSDLNSCESITKYTEKTGCIQDLSDSLIYLGKDTEKSNLWIIVLVLSVLTMIILFFSYIAIRK